MNIISNALHCIAISEGKRKGKSEKSDDNGNSNTVTRLRCHDLCLCACVFYDPIWLLPKYVCVCVFIAFLCVFIEFQSNVARVKINNIHFQKIYGLLFIENIAWKDTDLHTERQRKEKEIEWVKREIFKKRRKCSNANDGDAKKWKKIHYTNEREQEPKLVCFFSFNWFKMT